MPRYTKLLNQPSTLNILEKFYLFYAIFLAVSLLGVTKGFAQDFSELYKKVSPGVVVIITEEKELVSNHGNSKQVSVGGQGAGFLVDQNQVVTAAHVVQTAEKIVIRFEDGDEIPAKVKTSYKNADVALLELIWPKKEGTVLKMGDSDKMKVGNRVFIIGSPMGLYNSFSSGYISGRLASNKSSSPLFKLEYFQTDASINTGNSGGPMFNTDGEVIGIVSHILTKSGGFEGLGFAATSNIAQKLLYEESMMWTGADGYLLTGQMAKIFNLPQAEGWLIQKVVFHSPLGIMGVQGGKYQAEIEGEKLLLGGDIILSIGGIEMSTKEELLGKLTDYLAQLSADDPLEIIVLRGGKKVTLKK